MKRVIDFHVSVGGMRSQIIRIEYESHPQVQDVMQEAVDALKKEVGHDDIEVVYCYWIE